VPVRQPFRDHDLTNILSGAALSTPHRRPLQKVIVIIEEEKGNRHLDLEGKADPYPP
jgi:hypothetical protein